MSIVNAYLDSLIDEIFDKIFSDIPEVKNMTGNEAEKLFCKNFLYQKMATVKTNNYKFFILGSENLDKQ